MSVSGRFCSFKYEYFSYIGGNSLTNEELLVYCGVGLNFYKQENVFLSYNHLKAVIFGKNAGKSKMDILKKGFNGLVEKGFIKIIDQYNDNEFVCDVSNISNIRKEKFFIIKHDEFDKIISCCGKINAGNVLRYYLCCISTFENNKITDYNYKFGYKSQLYLSALCGSNLPTIKRYNDLLEKNSIMYIARRKKSVFKNIESGNLYKSDTNVYCRYEDKDKCIEYIRLGCVQTKKDEFINVSNEMRSLSQKYNYFKRTYGDSICEDIDKVKSAYEAAKQWNEYAKEDFEKAIENGKHPDKPKYKDLSIFDKYDLTV